MRTWIAVALIVLALATAAKGGHMLGYLEGRAESFQELKERGDTIQGLTASNAQLLLGIAAQNQAVAVAEAQTEGAKQVQLEAQKRAEVAAQLSESRMSKIDKALKDASTAGEVLARYWEIRQ